LHRTALAALAVAAAGLVVAPGGASLYVYIPDVLVIRTPAEADAWLTDAEISLGVQPSSDPIYATHPELKRLDRTAKIMTKHWAQLDGACDGNAVFALLYLTMTWSVREHVLQGYFDDNDYLATITTVFASLYLDAWNHWKAGDVAHVQKGWQEAFRAGSGLHTSVLQDEFLGINAHVNYDLGVAIATLGTTDANGHSRKPDMDRINHVLADDSDDAAYYLALYDGPTPPSPPTYSKTHTSRAGDTATWLTIEPIAGWREGSWANALAIEGLPTPEARAAHDAAMQDYAWSVAQGFQTPNSPDPAPARLAYCQANPPSLWTGPTVEHPL
jgi:hypothetical protein